MEDYYFVSQGKTRIPGVNDAEEMWVTEVSVLNWKPSKSLDQIAIQVSLEFLLQFFRVSQFTTVFPD